MRGPLPLAAFRPVPAAGRLPRSPPEIDLLHKAAPLFVAGSCEDVFLTGRPFSEDAVPCVHTTEARAEA